ncbi:hypothetical protein GE09DRAFT_1111964 [Coniochaeta sp. 2T2.1]|nr:hypothetical protein GE09DRAFT_1111964 [Coniochaeta sp. 2T2.1]
MDPPPPSWLQGYHWPPLRWIALGSALRPVSSSTALPGTVRSHMSKLHQASFGFPGMSPSYPFVIGRVRSYYSRSDLQDHGECHRQAKVYDANNSLMAFTGANTEAISPCVPQYIGNGLLRVLNATISVPSFASLGRRRASWEMDDATIRDAVTLFTQHHLVLAKEVNAVGRGTQHYQYASQERWPSIRNLCVLGRQMHAEARDMQLYGHLTLSLPSRPVMSGHQTENLRGAELLGHQQRARL